MRNLLALVVCVLLAASCDQPEGGKVSESIDIPSGITANDLGTQGYTVTSSEDNVSIDLKHVDAGMDGSKILIKEDNQTALDVDMNTTEGNVFSIKIDRSTLSGSIRINDKNLHISEQNGDSWSNELTREEIKDLTTLFFALKDVKSSEELSVGIEKMSNANTIFGCKETFVQGGGRRSAVKNSVRDEAEQYIKDHDCTSGVIIGDVDCGCLIGDFVCGCVTTYILEGCACVISI